MTPPPDKPKKDEPVADPADLPEFPVPSPAGDIPGVYVRITSPAVEGATDVEVVDQDGAEVPRPPIRVTGVGDGEHLIVVGPIPELPTAGSGLVAGPGLAEVAPPPGIGVGPGNPDADDPLRTVGSLRDEVHRRIDGELQQGTIGFADLRDLTASMLNLDALAAREQPVPPSSGVSVEQVWHAVQAELGVSTEEADRVAARLGGVQVPN